MKTVTVYAALAALLSGAALATGEESRFLTGLHGEGYLGLFANQADDFYDDRYVSEGALEADLFLWRFTPRTHLVWRITTATGMGESTTSGLPFAVQEVHYALIPFIETESRRWLVRFGLDHGCDHLILKDTDDPWYIRDQTQVPRDVYNNRLFAAMGSPSHRRATWRRLDADPEADASRWIHYVEVGYYLRELFGWIDEEALNEGNDWWWDLKHDLRCRLWSGRAGHLFAAHALSVLLDREDDVYWRDRIGLEFHPAGTRVGIAFELAWNAIDEHPRDARDDLVELVARFFF